MDRTILHCDCNGFYASVEEVLNPELKNIPMAVGGNEENRHGIILAKNELAKKYNIKTGENIWQARKKCPNLIVVKPHRGEYLKYSKIVNSIYERYTDLVEPFGIDESWLDITHSMHLFGTAKEIADELREVVYEETGLTISVGVSDNKAWAKLGSDYKKPNATTVFDRSNYRELIFPLPIEDLLYVGKSSKDALNRLNINTIGDLAVSDKKMIIDKLGKAGEVIYNYANGIDDSPVRSVYEAREIKSVGNGLTFKHNLRSWSDVRVGVEALSDEVARRMRKHNVKAFTVQVNIKDENFKTISRQKKLDTPTNLAKELAENAMNIIEGCWNINRAIRMITITGANLVDSQYSMEQISLFDNGKSERRERQEHLEESLDKLKDKYGESIVKKGSILNNDLGIDE